MEGAFRLASASSLPVHVIFDSEDLKLRFASTRDECLTSDAHMLDFTDVSHAVRCDDKTFSLLSRSGPRRAIVLRSDHAEQVDAWVEGIEKHIAACNDKRAEAWDKAASGMFHSPHAPAPAAPAASAAVAANAVPAQQNAGGGLGGIFSAAASLFTATTPAPAAAPAAAPATTPAAANVAPAQTKYEQEVAMRTLKPGVKGENPKPWDWDKDNLFCIVDAGVLRYAFSRREDALGASAKTLKLAECTCARGNNDTIAVAGPGVALTLKPGTKDAADSFFTTLKKYCKGEDAKKAETKAADEARLKREDEERKRKAEAEAKAAEEARLKREDEERKRKAAVEEEARRVAEAKALEEAARKASEAAAAALRATSPKAGGAAMESELKVLQNPSRPWEFDKRYFLVAGDALKIGVNKADGTFLRAGRRHAAAAAAARGG